MFNLPGEGQDLNESSQERQMESGMEANLEKLGELDEGRFEAAPAETRESVDRSLDAMYPDTAASSSM